MSPQAIRHFSAILIAIGLVFGLRIQDVNLQPLTGAFDQRSFETYTPYFPGLDALETHEIFAPENRNKKKIVLFGASSVDSIGCDSTWSKHEPNQIQNAHYSCSITGQLNALLKEAHLDDWKAFNLARNGTKLTPELYVYSRILPLKPEIVIYGDGNSYYLYDNADAAALTPAKYAFMDQIFDSYPDTAEIWRNYKANLRRHGWTADEAATPTPAADLGPQPRVSTNLEDLLIHGLVLLRSRLPFDGMPRPVALAPSYRDWTRPAYAPHAFDNHDPGFGYFQGLKLLAAMQKERHEKAFFFFCPLWDYAADPDYQAGLVDIFGRYLKSNDIPFASYGSMEMKPVSETYDGYHHTLMGNHKIAEVLLHDLIQNGLLP